MMRRFLGTMLGQILAIVVISSTLTYFLFLVLLWTLFPAPPPPSPWPWPWTSAYRISGVVQIVRATPQAGRAAVVAAASRQNFSVHLTRAPVPCARFAREAHELQKVLADELDDPSFDFTVHSCGRAGRGRPKNVQVLVKLGDDTLEFLTGAPEHGHFPRLSFPFISAILFLCVAVAGMSVWAISLVIGPLRRLSEKADAFGRDIAVAPIEEEGPLEIRRAARAFNLMQERVARSVRDRTRMLAAISHDLRTPLTRMRLLVETSPEGEMRAKLLRNVSLMQSMVTSALAFLSGRFDREEKEWLDLGALLMTLRDEYEEKGAAVRYDGPERFGYFCRPNAMARALTNLLDNACYFGERVVIRVDVGEGRLVIDVEDDGPGIPEERRSEVIEPFVRLDPARADRPGSVGLGLSIVHEILADHGGSLALLDRRPHGLIARMILPAVGADDRSDDRNDQPPGR